MTGTDFAPYLGVFLIGLSKAGFATGLGMLTTPLLATAIPAREAIGVVLPLLVASDLITLALFRKSWRFSLIRWPLLGACGGIGLGMFFVNALPDAWLKLSIGCIGLFLTTALVVRNVWYPAGLWRPSPWEGGGVGAVAGFVSTLAHAAGPIMALFFIAQKMDKAVFVASNGLFFTLNNLLKLPPYVMSDIINAQTLRQDLRYLPMIPLGVVTGWLMNRWLPQKHFNGLVYVLLFLTSVELIAANWP